MQSRFYKHLQKVQDGMELLFCHRYYPTFTTHIKSYLQDELGGARGDFNSTPLRIDNCDERAVK